MHSPKTAFANCFVGRLKPLLIETDTDVVSLALAFMPLRHRPMQPQDVPECVDILASYPAVAGRYGNKISLLAQAWLRLLSCEAKGCVVIIDEDGSTHPPICCFGISVFVKDDFVREMKTAPQFWVGPELVKRLLQGNSPVVSSAELRQSNVSGGLNLVVWEGLVRSGYESQQELHRLMIHEFIQNHRGYLWKELIAERSETAERLAFTLKTGAMLWDTISGCYTSSLQIDHSEIVMRPHTVGITRELELE